MKIFVLVLCIMSWFTVGASGAQAESEPLLEADSSLGEPPLLEPPSEEQSSERSYALAGILRCPVCQGLSVADSRSDAAVAMKDRISELVKMGYSDQQIVDYFVGRYGEFALLKPKYEHRVLWAAPVVVGLFGLVFVGLRVRQHTISNAPTQEQEDIEGVSVHSTMPPAELKASDELAEYRAQVLRELDN